MPCIMYMLIDLFYLNHKVWYMSFIVFKFTMLVTTFLFQGLHASLRGSNCCYMVLFQYGSICIVLFNAHQDDDDDDDDYSKAAEK